MADPAVPACLSTPYSSKPGQRGGTIIAEDVLDLEEHERRLWDPDGYRPGPCELCGRCLHAHDFRIRTIRGHPELSWTSIRRYLCPLCRAVWQVLPAWLARCLHRTWAVVQATMAGSGVVEGEGADLRVSVPKSTVARWRGRLLLPALVLVQVLLGAGVEVGSAASLTSTRAELIDSLAGEGLVDGERKLEQVAGWVHRVMPGVRLM